MDEVIELASDHTTCLLCLKFKAQECNWSNSDKCKMFESFCCFLSIDLPDKYCWNFEKEDFPFCKLCVPFLQELVRLFDQLENLQGKLEVVVNTMGDIFTSSLKEMAQIPFPTSSNCNEIRTASKFKFFKEQLREIFSPEKNSPEIFPPQVSADINANQPAVNGRSETSKTLSWIEIELKDEILEETSVGNAVIQKKDDENMSAGVSGGTNLCDSEGSTGSKLESSLENAIMEPTNSTTLSLIGESKLDSCIPNESTDEIPECKLSRTGNCKRIKYEENVECTYSDNAQQEVGRMSSGTKKADRVRSKELGYLMRDGINWEEKLVQCPKPPWTAIFSSHGFVYAGISVLVAKKGFQCSLCNSRWLNSESAIDHLEFAHLGCDHWYPCNQCRRIFRCTLGLQCHNERFHRGESVTKWDIICVSCNKRFYSRDLLYQHLKVHLSAVNVALRQPPAKPRFRRFLK